MKKIFVLLLIIFMIAGCGKVAQETGGGSGGGGGGSTPPARRLPIDRPFTVAGGTITFTDTVVTAGITILEYNTGSTPNISLRIQDTGLVGKSIIVLTRSGNLSFTPTAGQLPNNFSIWVTSGSMSSTVFSLGATENIIDPANSNNYIQLMVDGVVVEDYWLDDFLK